MSSFINAYLQSSADAARAAQNVFAYSPNYADVFNKGLQAQATKDLADIKRKASQDALEIETKARKDYTKGIQKARSEAQAQTRMAGVLSALGGLGMYGTQKIIKDRNKLPEVTYTPPEPVDRSGVDAAQQSVLDQLDSMETQLSDFGDAQQQQIEQVETAAATLLATADDFTGNGGKLQAFKAGGKGWSVLGPTLQFAEGTWRKGDRAYNTGYNYNEFEDLSKHPDTVWFADGAKRGSAAAGAYQFMPDTYASASNALGLTDFTPASQEKAAEYLATKRGVDTSKPFTTVTQLRQASNLLAPEWASMPKYDGKSAYEGDAIGNSAKRFESIRNFYDQQLIKMGFPALLEQ